MEGNKRQLNVCVWEKPLSHAYLQGAGQVSPPPTHRGSQEWQIWKYCNKPAPPD